MSQSVYDAMKQGKQRPQSHIYIGPSVPPIGLKKFTLYRVEGLPSGLQKYAEAQPVLRSLYVPTSRLAEASAKLIRQGTAEYLAAEEMRTIGKTILSR